MDQPDEMSEFHCDCRTLRAISEGVGQLEEELAGMRAQGEHRERGYFLPDEDAKVRQLLLTYRNYRIAVFDIINRCQAFAELPSPPRQRVFLLGFGAAVMLYNWSWLLIESYRKLPKIRKKLNEPAVELGIEAGLFETIYESLTNLDNRDRLDKAAKLFDEHLDDLRKMASGHQDMQWLLHCTEEQYGHVKRTWIRRHLKRLRRDIGHLARHSVRPLEHSAYKVQSRLFDVFGNIWFEEPPQVDTEHIDAFRTHIQPGDFFIVRPERKASTVFLPGWWTHAALYYGGHETLSRLQIPADGPSGTDEFADAERVVLEALAAGVVKNPLERTLRVDHAVLFRPRLDADTRDAALRHAFQHLGKPYDFHFDLSRADAFVCTELIYRTFHGKGSIAFTPIVRMGKPTLSADDIVKYALAHQETTNRPFDVVGLSKKNIATGESTFTTGTAAWQTLAATLASESP